MLLVKTKLKQSEIHGLGVFADEFIPKGTKTWEFNSRFDLSFSKEEVESLPEHAKLEVKIHAYVDKETGTYRLCSDNAKFMNHSSEPNVLSENNYDVALRDILPGEELTCDYSAFDAESSEKLSFI